MPQHLGADDRLEPPRGAQRVSHHRFGGADVHLMIIKKKKKRSKRKKGTKQSKNGENKPLNKSVIRVHIICMYVRKKEKEREEQKKTTRTRIVLNCREKERKRIPKGMES